MPNRNSDVAIVTDALSLAGRLAGVGSQFSKPSVFPLRSRNRLVAILTRIKLSTIASKRQMIGDKR